MDSTRVRAEAVAALLFLMVASVQSDFLEPRQPSLLSRTEIQTRLPCLYQVEDEEKVVQVTWWKELPDGSKDQIITAHFMDGHTEFGRYTGRMKFESSSPTQDSTLLILSTEESDEGKYTCHITTFPSGNFERQIALTVWVLPISILDPMVLVEGQPYGVVASCRAVGRPIPSVSWDTDLPGQTQDRTSEAGSVSSHYLLHPLRSMNGKKLDCLVSHPGLEQPRRLSHRLEVQYPPDASISSPSEQWHVGLEKAELVCKVGGYPKPENITWTWRGGALPDGVSAAGERLTFSRAVRLNDSGVYECLVKNDVGKGTGEFVLSIGAKSPRIDDDPNDPRVNNRLLIIICASAGALVLVLIVIVVIVTRYHQRKNKKLAMELSEKTEEINSLSRQASFRRLNSASTDLRVQGEDYALLRVDSRMKNSLASLGRPIYKGSHSTLGGMWGPHAGVEVDELGRPVVWADGRESLRRAELEGEQEERRKRVESYVKSSNMSLDSGLPSSLVPLKAQQEDGTGPREPDLGHPRELDPPCEVDWAPDQSVADEQQDDEDSGSYQISEALNNHFYYSNGVLRPRPHSNAILLNPRGQVI